MDISPIAIGLKFFAWVFAVRLNRVMQHNLCRKMQMSIEPDDFMWAWGQRSLVMVQCRIKVFIIRRTCVHELLHLLRLIHLCRSNHVSGVVPSRPRDF